MTDFENFLLPIDDSINESIICSTPSFQFLSLAVNENQKINEIAEGLRNSCGSFSNTSQISNYMDDFSDVFFDNIPTPNGITSQQSKTVNPVHFTFVHDEPPQSVQEQIGNLPKIQCNALASKQIEILSQPRSEFRPRTERESQDSSHFLRCAKGSRHEHPTIRIQPNWSAGKTIIQVSLVCLNDQPHLYTIDNKERRTSSLIYKEDEANTLYFYVTEQDCQKGEKTFFIEFIKGKQVGQITKEIIAKYQLNQSKLSFTCLQKSPDGIFYPERTSTVFSDIMIEKYGDFSIIDVFPRRGPMSGNEKVCFETKGPLPKDYKANLIMKIRYNGRESIHEMQKMQKSGNNFTFLMPAMLNASLQRVDVDIVVEYNQEVIWASTFQYLRSLDGDLNGDDASEPHMAITGALPVAPHGNSSLWRSATEIPSVGRTIKRFRNE